MPNKTLKRRLRAAGLVATTGDAKKKYGKYRKLSKAEARDVVKSSLRSFNQMSGQKKQDARIETAFNNTHSKLVPPSGIAPTKAGEAVRATMRIAYRSYNDGDVWNQGYGRETVNPSVRYLTNKVKHPETQEALAVLKDASKGGWTSEYKQSIIGLEKAVMKYASPKNGMRKKPNTDDSR